MLDISPALGSLFYTVLAVLFVKFDLDPPLILGKYLKKTIQSKKLILCSSGENQECLELKEIFKLIYEFLCLDFSPPPISHFFFFK